MKRFSKYCMLITCCFLMFGLNLSSAYAKEYKWQLAHTRATQSQIHKDMLEFADKVRVATNGQMQITVMPSGQLGDWTVAQERVAMGNFEMTLSPMAAAIDKRMEITYVPGLTDSWDGVSKKLVKGSPFIEMLSKWTEEQNLTLLAPYPCYLGGIGFTKEIKDPGNPSLKRGLKLRIPDVASHRAMVSSLGYIPTPIPWTDVFASLQTGVVDGVEGGGAEAYFTSGFSDVLKSYLPINTHFELWFCLVNTKKYKALPKEIQEAISQAAIDIQNKRLAEGPKEKKFWEDKLRAAGIKVYELTEEQIAAYNKVIREGSWEKTRDIVGPETFDKAVEFLR